MICIPMRFDMVQMESSKDNGNQSHLTAAKEIEACKTMKNNDMKTTKGSKQSWLGSISPSEMENFKKRIAGYRINEELIAFIEQHLSTTGSINEKLTYLFFAKKVLPYLKREPQTDHFLAFEEEYRNDRDFFEPMKWLDNEIEFWTNVSGLSQSKETPQNIVEAKMELSKQWLTKEEIMQMLRFSRTTLNRRIAEGMPCHAKGKAVFFNLEEVSEWLKEDEAA